MEKTTEVCILPTMDEQCRLQVSLSAKYRPCIIRGRMLHEQTLQSEFPQKRQAGDNNLDLWWEGSLYPMNPSTGKRPKFNDHRSLLEFVGEGENGLLGYALSLSESQNHHLLGAESHTIMTLRQRISELELHDRQEQSESGADLRTKVQKLQGQNSDLELTLTNLRREVSILQSDLEQSEQSEVLLEADIDAINGQYSSKVDSLQQVHHLEIQNLRLQLENSRKNFSTLQSKWDRLQSTPYGRRKQVRARKDISALAPGGGQAKASRRLVRSIIAPITIRAIQEGNAAYHTKQRLHGTEEQQIQCGKVLSQILSKKEVNSILKSPALQSVGIGITNRYLEKIGEEVGAEEILAVCDRNAITQSGYNSMYKEFKTGARLASTGIRIGCLPKPYHVSLLRQELNSKLSEFVGEYYHINNSTVFPCGLKSKKKEPMKIKLTTHNSLFCDIEAVQRTMVQLYQITPTELQGKPLIFVLKLDEAEIVHSQKMERISITVMNRALNSEITVDNPEYFAVQSEREIFPVGCFQVEKESHEVLSWVLNQTHIPSLIKAQDAGQALIVPGVGEFQVEWHMSADMKTVKCMYGLSHGVNAKHSCMFCLQERTKSIVVTEAQAEASFKKRQHSWDGGLFSENIQSKPITGLAAATRWKPILPIPMVRVHMCSLHAFNRIIEKIVHLHFQFIWTLRDKPLQKEAISEMQKVLSSTGAHGGNVIIFKDAHLSSSKNNIPSKPSFNGVHVAKLFDQSTLPGGSRKLYLDVVNAEKNFLDSGASKRAKLDVWMGLDKLREYFSGLTLSLALQNDFERAIHAWGHQYIVAFGETHVTHYIHAIVRHAPWFVKTYGSLSVWSCQGMEYSHYAAKSAYQRHTQHGGGRYKKSPLVQTYQHWYRIIQHRFREQSRKKKDREALGGQVELLPEARIQKRRESALASSANAHSALWREKCQKKGSKWVLQNDEVQSTADHQVIDS